MTKIFILSSFSFINVFPIQYYLFPMLHSDTSGEIKENGMRRRGYRHKKSFESKWEMKKKDAKNFLTSWTFICFFDDRLVSKKKF